MQEEKKIKINKETLMQIADHQSARADILKKHLNDHLPELQDLLFNYHYDKRERVYDLSIAAESIDFDGITGSFKLLYMIGFFNACADLDYNAPEKMTINFSIDKEASEIHLTGEYWPERGQDEI